MFCNIENFAISKTLNGQRPAFDFQPLFTVSFCNDLHEGLNSDSQTKGTVTPLGSSVRDVGLWNLPQKIIRPETADSVRIGKTSGASASTRLARRNL